MKSDTFLYILESSPTHHFIKLFLAILRCNNKETTMKVS